MNDRSGELKDALRAELEETRGAFHSLVDSLSHEAFDGQGLNPGWTNRQVLFHMLFALMLLEGLGPMARFFGRLPAAVFKPFAWLMDAFTGAFNWVNALGARGGGRVFNRQMLHARYERAHKRALSMIDAMKPDEWGRGMYYPARWDPLFSGYMTVEQVFRYPARHFKFHVGQIAR